ncbi:MAG: thermonuclease family protein [Archangium sp.]|nr:thermonuclease family protein [Archangium sp.]
MRCTFTIAVVLLTGCAVSTVTRTGGRRSHDDDKHDAMGAVMVNGQRTEVHWSDGDSFTFESGPYKGQGTRLVGYNTLEAYGPVHRWGSWTREELYTVAKGGADVAAAKVWECTTDGDQDAYRRVLVDCPDLALEMVKKGHGLAYAVKGRPSPKLLDAMHQAQRAKRGMWAKGVPRGLVTSLHSFAENAGSQYKTSSNRILDTRTGEAPLRKHTDNYATCEEVCIETGDDFSCMVYVPFERRYRDQPACLVGE